jgi:branched-chain amino acid transport system ATP-binding protein
MLIGQSVTKFFGGLVALDGVDFEVRRGELVGLIGANGAGKTTLFNIITGAQRVTRGKLIFEGSDITLLPPHQICRLGICRTYQEVRLFHKLSVLENVLVAATHGRGAERSLSKALAMAEKCIALMDLAEHAMVSSRYLNLFQRKRVQFARALAANPQLLLLDEFIAGLNPTETDRAIDLINRVHNELGVTIVAIEHVMRAIMSFSDRVIVLNFGKKIAEGTPQLVAQDPEVQRSYMGAVIA